MAKRPKPQKLKCRVCDSDPLVVNKWDDGTADLEFDLITGDAGLKSRIRWAWDVLRGRLTWMFSLDEKSVKKLVKYLNGKK